jgi:tetratricopeptide (TPR) repeat protein
MGAAHTPSSALLLRSLLAAAVVALATLLIWHGGDLAARAAANLGAVELSALYTAAPSITAAQRAETYYRQALAWGGERPAYLRGLGYALYAQGRTGEAADLWRQVEGSAARFMLQGYLARLAGDYASSLKWYAAAAAVAPELADPHFHVAVAADQLGDSAAAEAALRKALTATRFEGVGTSDISSQLAGVIARRSSPPAWDEVADLLAQALAAGDFRSPLSPRSQARFWYAEALRQQGRIDDAITQLSALTADDATEYWGRLRLADLLRNRRGEVSQAEALLKQASAVAPERAQAYLALGRLYQETGRNEEAIPLFKHVLELEPDNAEALSRLAQLQ